MGKNVIPSGATGREGSVTSEKIASWSADEQWGNAGIALRLGAGVCVIDVDHYGNKTGATQLAELEAKYGALPATITNTSRSKDSPSRQHFFLMPEVADLVSKAAPDVDILQKTHRYAVVFPSVHPEGRTYEWYGYDGEPLDEIPSVGDLEMLPQEWVDALRAPEREEHEGFNGDIDEWLESLVQGDPSSRVLSLIDAIPRTDFGHDEMRAISFRLARLGAEREPGIDRAVAALYREWLRGKYNTSEYRHDLDVTLQGAIQKAGALESEVPPLLSSIEVFNEVHPSVFELARQKPDIEDEGSFAVARRDLIKACFEQNIDKQRILTVLWNSAVGRPMQHEPNGLTLLWREIEFVATQPVEHLATVTQIQEKRKEHADLFLTRTEKEYLAEQGEWWGSRYVRWTQDRQRRTNPPYNRANRWTILSLVFSPHAHLYPDGTQMDLNLFQMILGDSSTGKTKSMDLMREPIDAYFAHDATPNIGGDLSKEALSRVLVQRDGQVSWLHRDDVDGLLREIQGNKGNWNEGLIQRWCEFYEGRVEPFYRQTDKENSGIQAHCYLVMHLVGVESSVTDAAEELLWSSGLFPRFTFMIGEPKDREVKGRRLNLVRGEAVSGGDMMAKQWAAEFTAAVRTLSIQGDDIGFTESANDRFAEFDERLLHFLNEHPMGEKLEAASSRFGNIVMKAASLVALTEGEMEVNRRHLLIALEQAEEWWRNTVYMVQATAESRLQKEMQKLVNMLKSTVGKELRQAEVYAAFRPAQRAEAIMNQLEKEERIVRDENAGTRLVRLREDAVGVAA